MQTKRVYHDGNDFLLGQEFFEKLLANHVRIAKAPLWVRELGNSNKYTGSCELILVSCAVLRAVSTFTNTALASAVSCQGNAREGSTHKISNKRPKSTVDTFVEQAVSS